MAIPVSQPTGDRAFYIHYQEGNANGPFTLYLSGSSGLTLYDSGVTISQLALGYLVSIPYNSLSSSVLVMDAAYGCVSQQNLFFPSATPTRTPTPSRTPSVTPSISVSPSRTPSISVSPSLSVSSTPPPSTTKSATPTPSVSPSFNPSPSVSPSITPSPSLSRTPSPSPPFRSYSFYGTSSTYDSYFLACCGQAAGRPYFTLVEFPGFGDYIFENAACTIPISVIPYSKYIWMTNFSGYDRAFLVNSFGQIVDDSPNNKPCCINCSVVYPFPFLPDNCP